MKGDPVGLRDREGTPLLEGDMVEFWVCNEHGPGEAECCFGSRKAAIIGITA